MTVSTIDAFVTQDVFTRLAWSIYAQDQQHQSRGMTKFLTDMNTLIQTTRLNTHTLVHVLHYLEKLTVTRCDLVSQRRSTEELFELLVVLMMVSNKANDDSSYTMKTWDNLTPLTIPLLKKRELAVLKGINYSVFLKSESYMSFCSRLHTMATHQGLIIDTSVFSPPLSQQLQPVQLQPLLSLPSLLPPLCQTSTGNPSPFISQDYPLTPRSPTQDFPLLLSTIPQYAPPQLKRSFEEESTLSYYQSAKRQHYVTSQLPLPSSRPIASQYQAPTQTQLLTPRKRVVDHENCACCCLTNMTNVYHSSLKVAKL